MCDIRDGYVTTRQYREDAVECSKIGIIPGRVYTKFSIGLLH